MMAANQVIFTASPEFAQPALTELQQIDRQSKLIQWLDSGVGWVQLGNLTFSDLAPQIASTKAAFIRHLCPILETLPLDLASVQRAIATQMPLLDRTQTLSVQIRSPAKTINSFELRTLLTHDLLAAGFTVAAKDPAQIISIFCDRAAIHLGFSKAAANLSSWPGGMHRFAQEEGQISRAEFKLLEAIHVFDLTLPTQGLALDLGASPGGWTRILRRLGLSVVAVDPGNLADSLHTDPKIAHYRQLVQQYLPNCRDRYGLIVNDMRMDAVDSAKIMVLANSVLHPEGLAIMTLKLPSKGVKGVVNTAIARLETHYQILGVRSLFHNRQEATLALRSLPQNSLS